MPWASVGVATMMLAPPNRLNIDSARRRSVAIMSPLCGRADATGSIKLFWGTAQLGDDIFP